MLAIVQRDVFLKLVLNIQKNYANNTNDYPLAPDKLEIKREVLSDYQPKITELCNIPIGKLTTLRKTRSNSKKIHRIKTQSITMVKTIYIEFNTQKRVEAEKNNDKSMNSAIYGKTMEKLRNESM